MAKEIRQKMKRESCNLKQLKEDYEKLRKKYGLPEFSFLNENFEIEDICYDETELLLKKIRKQIMEKIAFELRVLEMLINPQNAPLFIFNIIKYFNEEDKKVINTLYKKLNQIAIEIFGLDIEYKEEKEAEFIKNFMRTWKEVQSDLRKIEKAMRRCSSFGNKNNKKSYLG